MKFSSTPGQVCRSVSIPCFKINAPFFCCPFFGKKYLKLQIRINKMVNQQFRLPPYCSPSELTSRIHPLIFVQTRQGFFSKLRCSGYWKIHLRVKKMNLDIFTCASPQVLIITSKAEGNVLIAPRQRFFKSLFSSCKKGRGGGGNFGLWVTFSKDIFYLMTLWAKNFFNWNP